MTAEIAIIGECMLQIDGLKAGDDPSTLNTKLSYGGDTLNTALYLARMGIQVDYVTALGDDSLSTWMLSRWQEENIGCDLVERFSDCVPGIYLIELDGHGERSFKYWRKDSPASRMFDDPTRAKKLYDKLIDYPCLYLSGISLALYQEPALQSFMHFLEEYVGQGGRIFFDGNYRERLWKDARTALDVYKSLYAMTEVALPTLDDERQLTGRDSAQDVIHCIHQWGATEVVLKMGPQGCIVSNGQGEQLVPAEPTTVVDTTSAGDSFNAAYIASKLGGHDSIRAAEAGHRLASVVIQHPGAIIPSSSMPVD